MTFLAKKFISYRHQNLCLQKITKTILQGISKAQSAHISDLGTEREGFSRMAGILTWKLQLRLRSQGYCRRGSSSGGGGRQRHLQAEYGRWFQLRQHHILIGGWLCRFVCCSGMMALLRRSSAYNYTRLLMKFGDQHNTKCTQVQGKYDNILLQTGVKNFQYKVN